ncbi:MAG: ABC transporter ATP-binding protein [Opitutales bacterium]|nr:ABC transporter ATP-binding protein [Opitutales bacterium]
MTAFLQLEKISKVYGKGMTEVIALQPTDITIDKGQMVAIIGPSGSGKSTLMHILGFLDTPTTGTIKLEGQPISRRLGNSLARIRNREIGFVFQSFNLLPKLTILQNVMLPLLYAGYRSRARKKMAMEALERVGLGNRVTHRPSELSGGQCQRAAIARALVTNPRILLADEPTGNLDSQTGRSILELFWDLHQQGQTIVLVTHDDLVAQIATRRIALKDGAVAVDTPQTGGLPAEWTNPATT